MPALGSRCQAGQRVPDSEDANDAKNKQTEKLKEKKKQFQQIQDDWVLGLNSHTRWERKKKKKLPQIKKILDKVMR